MFSTRITSLRIHATCAVTHPVKESWTTLYSEALPVQDTYSPVVLVSTFPPKLKTGWTDSYYLRDKLTLDVSILSTYNPWTCQQRDAGFQCSHQRDFGLLSKLFLRHQDTVMTIFTHSISVIGKLFCICCRKQKYILIKFYFCLMLFIVYFVLMSYKWIKCDQCEHGDMGQNRSIDMKSLHVIMKDACKPAQTSLSLLLFA